MSDDYHISNLFSLFSTPPSPTVVAPGTGNRRINESNGVLHAFVSAAALVRVALRAIRGHAVHSSQASPLKMKALAGEIHTQVREFVERGFTRLVPMHGNPETPHLRIDFYCELAVIDQHAYNDKLQCTITRSYIVRSNGIVNRHVAGRSLRLSDELWCHEPLTQTRLEYVLRALRSFSPPAVK